MEEKDIQKILADMTGKVDEYQKEIKELRTELEKVKAAPIQTVKLPRVKAHEKFLGYDLSKQGLALKGEDEEEKDKIAKWLISRVRLADRNKDWTPEIQKAYGDNALQEGTATEGGYLVPDEFTDQVLAFARLNGFALNECTIWPMSSDVRRIPAENALVSVAWTAEEADLTESEPTFAEVVLTNKKLGGIGLMSNELMQDATVDIVSILTSQFGEAIGQELDNQVLNGTGSPCSGVLTAACGYSVVMASGATNFSAITGDYLSQMISRLAENKRVGARFILNKLILHYIRIDKASTAGTYQWGSLAAGDPSTIWGYPYTESEKAPSSSGVSTAFVSLGNFKNFAIGRRLQNMTLDLDPYSYFKSYRTQYRIVCRFGLQIGLANGFVRLLTAAS